MYFECSITDNLKRNKNIVHRIRKYDKLDSLLLLMMTKLLVFFVILCIYLFINLSRSAGYFRPSRLPLKCEMTSRESNLIDSYRSKKHKKTLLSFLMMIRKKMCLQQYLLFFSMILFTQSTIYIGIIHNNNYPGENFNIFIPNIIYCNRSGLKLQTQWIDSSNPLSNLIDKLELNQNSTTIYLALENEFSTKLVKDFCETYRIPFVSMYSYGNIATTFVIIILI